jgi:signal transduction histidine kinase
VHVTVADSGPGVPPDTASRIFDRGFSTKSAAVLGGRGIGLSLVRRICEQRGGAVGVQYADGAVFTAVLPVRAPAPESFAVGETNGQAGIPPVSANGAMR